MSRHAPEQSGLEIINMNRKLGSVIENKARLLLAIKLQLVFDGAMNSPNEIDVPAEKKHQESLPLRQCTHRQTDSSMTKAHL